ncbi:MAG: NrfD/PsrC family molybdoenzyme membrane anchor subunit [Verrucomicrobiia bacterium]
MAHGSTLAMTDADAQIMRRRPIVLNGRGYHWITEHISGISERGAPKWWWFATAFTGLVTLMAVAMFTYLVSTGVGVWGLNQPVSWAWDITNFVFWIGIGHAGTLISAILFLTRQKWRTSINRSAEAMTLFAVMCAGLFPAFHVGRVWMVWFLAPVPTSMGIWQNFRSPLLWDVFAVSTYFTVSIIFWYVGLVPDLATLRDRAKTRLRKVFFGIFSLGWRGSNRQWRHYEKAYLVLAGISTPLVLSVHSVVSFDFAVSIVPGWHTTIFPPYFVAGAIFGGFAMVLTLLLPARAIFGLHDLITAKHIDNMCKIILLTGSIVGYAYTMEFFIAWYSGNPFEQFAFINRATGPYWWAYWAMISCNVLAPQFFWFKRCRRNIWIIFFVVMCVNAGMWFERFVIIVTSLHRDFLPSSWGYFQPTWVDICTFVGTIGFFVFLFLVFIRFLPMITMFEVKAILPEADPHHGAHGRKGGHA